MPTAKTCIWDGKEITTARALIIRGNRKLWASFFCIHCGEQVRVHAGGGHTEAHFEHFRRNSACPYSHSDSYRYGGCGNASYKNTDSIAALEGYITERTYLARGRNAELVAKCKIRDKYRCQACGYLQQINGRFIVECHHLKPLASNATQVTDLRDLICLCPNCHRIAHTTRPPLIVSKIKKLLRSSL